MQRNFEYTVQTAWVTLMEPESATVTIIRKVSINKMLRGFDPGLLVPSILTLMMFQIRPACPPVPISSPNAFLRAYRQEISLSPSAARKGGASTASRTHLTKTRSRPRQVRLHGHNGRERWLRETMCFQLTRDVVRKWGARPRGSISCLRAVARARISSCNSSLRLPSWQYGVTRPLITLSSSTKSPQRSASLSTFLCLRCFPPTVASARWGAATFHTASSPTTSWPCCMIASPICSCI